MRSSLAKATLRDRRVYALVRADRNVTLDLSVVARIGSRTLPAGRATATDDSPNRTRRFAIALSARARRALRAARRARLTVFVEARGANGALATAQGSRTVRR